MRYGRDQIRLGLSNQNSILASCKKTQDSLGLWIPRRGFRIPATGFEILCQWIVRIAIVRGI